MYTEPLTLYREYVQNAADATSIVAGQQGLPNDLFPIQINVDPMSRAVRIRDHGCGIDNERFAKTLLTIGASSKRETELRGFRGVGRLVGLGFCQELVFRSRSARDEHVLELKWDCKALRDLLRHRVDTDLFDMIRSVVSVSSQRSTEDPDHFFDVILNGVVRVKNDDLLNRNEIINYLSQVAPVPFHRDFALGKYVDEIVSRHSRLDTYDIRIDGIADSITRPFRTRMTVSGTRECTISEIQPVMLSALDDGVCAVGWLGHHEYRGSFPRGSAIRGIRARQGNIQIGEDDIMGETFAEERFNAWSIGELHIVDRRIVPNGRRDHFEPNVHLGNFQNQFAPHARELSQRCRSTSKRRNSDRAIAARQAELRAVIDGAKGASPPILVLLAARRAGMLLDEIDQLSKKSEQQERLSVARGRAIPASLKAEVSRLRTRAAKLSGRSRSPRLRGQLEAMEAVFEATAPLKNRDQVRLSVLSNFLERVRE
jgi:hypothetical protein